MNVFFLGDFFRGDFIPEPIFQIEFCGDSSGNRQTTTAFVRKKQTPVHSNEWYDPCKGVSWCNQQEIDNSETDPWLNCAGVFVDEMLLCTGILMNIIISDYNCYSFFDKLSMNHFQV